MSEYFRKHKGSDLLVNCSGKFFIDVAIVVSDIASLKQRERERERERLKLKELDLTNIELIK